MTARRRRDEAGFTIIEVLVAMFLLTIGLLSLAGVLATVANRQHYSQAITNLTTLAQSALEQMKLSTYSSLASHTDAYGSITNFPGCQRRVIVTPNSDDSIRTIEIIVTDSTGLTVSMQTTAAK